MWNVRSGNKLVERNLKEAAQKKHIEALRKIRGQVDCSSPKQYSFLYSRLKAQQIKNDRQFDIETSNSILVSRMLHHSNTLPSSTSSSIYSKTSLHGPFRSRLERAIEQDNQKLVRRLQTAKSQYNRQAKYNWDFEKYRNGMAYSRMAPYYDFDTAKRTSNRPLSSKR